MASCPKELERNGPTKGMRFIRQQAEKLFQRYLNKKLSWFEIVENDQLVQYIPQLHSNIPRSNLIGNYQINGDIGCNSDGMGPWNNYKDFYNDRLKRQIRTLNVDPILDPIRNDVLKSIKEFQKFELIQFLDLPNVFTHNDLGVQNLIVSDENELKGIIDWEWSDSYSICEEYFRSYKPIIHNEQLETYQISTARTNSTFFAVKKYV